MRIEEAQHEKRGGIYAIRNRVNGKEYVGSAVCIRNRLALHLRSLGRGVHHSVKLQRAWDKYGATTFEFVVLAIVEDRAALIACEQEWLDALGTAEHGYNIAKTAGSRLGFQHTAESRQHLHTILAGRRKSPEHVAAVSAALTGRTLSDEHKANVSKGLSGKKLSQECREKISAAHLGKRRTKKHKAAMSAVRKGKAPSPECVAALSLATRGKPLSIAHRSAISRGMRDASARRNTST